MRDIILIGAPMDSGKRRKGCLMGPDAYRTAGLGDALTELGYRVRDWGNMAPAEHPEDDPQARIYKNHETVGWTNRLWRKGQDAMSKGLPIFLGGDHALSLGSVGGVNAYAAEKGQPQFLLWLDAHTDYHTPETTGSGNLHGTPIGYVTGRKGFNGFPKVERPIPQENVCILGLRSVDAPEREAMQETKIRAYDMRMIDETGIAAPLTAFLDVVAKAKGALHVSLDVDFLDPMIAPAVGTTVPGGATMREAHLVMEMICDSGLMTSLDLVELNPFLDERGRTAQVMVDLAASALGRRVFDRPTRAFS